MASLKFSLGMIPSTSKIEQAEKELVAEYDKLKTFSESEQLARYNELHELVNSDDFKNKRKEIKSLRYKDSEEYQREKEFNSLRKSKDIILYFKTKSNTYLSQFREMEGSEKIAGFEELEKFIESPEFQAKRKMKPIKFKDTEEYSKLREYKALRKDPEIKAYRKAGLKEGNEKTKTILRYEELEKLINTPEFQAKRKMKPYTFKDTEEYKKFQEYKRLKNSHEIKTFYKFRASKEYANYQKTEGSSRLARYGELKEYLATPEFKNKKEYLLDKKRYEKTDMYKNSREYDKLKKEPDIIWYFKVKDSTKFDVLKNRELLFSEEFEGSELDTSKWLTNYYWGEKLLKDRYSIESDLQAYTEKDNFEIRNSLLKINTKPQKVTGKVWSASNGFTKKEFNYTSGLINTGKSFRQQYGIFSAKIKLGNPAAKNAFWMIADKITPHIDICRTSKGKVWFDFFPENGKGSRKKVGGRYANKFFIYTLEWAADSLVWKINNKVVHKQTSNVPNEPMYISLAGGLDNPVSGMTSMEIDWVRVYKSKT